MYYFINMQVNIKTGKKRVPHNQNMSSKNQIIFHFMDVNGWFWNTKTALIFLHFQV